MGEGDIPVFVKELPIRGGSVWNLYPLGDLHLGDAACDEKRLSATIETIKNDPQALVVGMGDYASFITPSDTKRFRISSLKNKIVVQDMIGASADEVVGFLRPVKEKILGLLCGNHEDTVLQKCSLDPMTLICRELGVANFGMECFITLAFRHTGKSDQARPFHVYCHHGWGGPVITEGAVMTRYARARRHILADLYLFGHSHQIHFAPFQRVRAKDRFLGTENNEAIYENYTIINTGGFLKRSEYAVRKGYEHHPTGIVKVKIICHTNRGADVVPEIMI